MRRIWLLVILLGIVTIVVLAYTWQNIPYLNTFLIWTGMPQALGDAKTQIIETITTNPTKLISVIGGLGVIGTLKKWYDSAKGYRTQINQIRSLAQEEKGSLKATYDDAKSLLTGNIDQLKEEYSTLTTKYVDLEAMVTMKDAAIIDVQSELGKVQQQLIAEQAKLLETTKQLAEVSIANEQKTIPTTH